MGRHPAVAVLVIAVSSLLAVTCVLLLRATATRPVPAIATEHTVFVLKEPTSLSAVVALVRPLGTNVIAFENSGATRGGYFDPAGGPPEAVAARYAAGVTDQRALGAVFAVRVVGRFTPSALATPDAVAAYASVPATATVVVSPAGSDPPLIIALQKSRPRSSGGSK